MNHKINMLSLGLSLSLVFVLSAGAVSASQFSGESERILNKKIYPVDSIDIGFVDNSRKTMANGDYAGDDKRTLKSTIWYPAAEQPGFFDFTAESVAEGKFPLLVYSHGFMSFRSEGKHLVEHLAAQGYIIVATDYPLANFFAPGRPTINDLRNHPGDVSFLIDSLIALSGDPGSDFYGRVDASRIGVLGVSLGGLTSTLATFHKDLRDERIGAGVSIAGPASMFGPKFFATTDTPFMMIAADEDAMVDYPANASILLDRAPGAILVTTVGGSHTGFATTNRNFFRLLDNPDSIGCIAIKRGLNLEDAEGMEDPFEILGGEAEGIVPTPRLFPCPKDELPEAMPLEAQHGITALAALMFFESHFQQDEQAREEARNFVESTLASENKLARVEIAPFASQEQGESEQEPLSAVENETDVSVGTD